MDEELPVKKLLSAYGVKGFDVFSRYLPYVSPTNLYVLPTYHLLLYGVIRKFWSLAVDGTKILAASHKKTIKERAGGIVATDDHQSLYSCIFSNYKNWKIYEWLAWVDFWANYVLKDIELRGTLPTSS